MSLSEERLGETLEALAAICTRLRLSLTRDAAAFPISAEEAGSDDHELWDVLDAFLQRFGQALDQTLRKLFPRLQSAISGSDDFYLSASCWTPCTAPGSSSAWKPGSSSWRFATDWRTNTRLIRKSEQRS